MVARDETDREARLQVLISSAADAFDDAD
jgi:hypothetical protein